LEAQMYSPCLTLLISVVNQFQLPTVLFRNQPKHWQVELDLLSRMFG